MLGRVAAPSTATDIPRYSVAGNHWLDILPLLTPRDSVKALVTRGIKRHQFCWCSVSCLTALYCKTGDMRDLAMTVFKDHIEESCVL
ncbi:hypothetical protein E2C01_047644 [Portunus trituberculatus]|uniref:Uncharacterized protein n=1 Tax=Portunus trituberculatus TaxID=210409 RepID=A0A5B7G8G6_PORTR|nr:hypothetical protein [Portunus trituberculatus]